jgi:ribosomal protein L32/cytoskeletal protein RodZ
MKFCPQCGSSLVPEDRFCQECGFDTSEIQTEVNQVTETQASVVEEVVNVITPTVPPVDENPKSSFCPKCGTSIADGDRFCPECGFDTTVDQPVGVREFKPVEQPEVIHETEPVFIPPVVELPPPPAPPKPTPIIQPPAEPVRPPAVAYVPPSRPVEPAVKSKSGKSWVWIVLLVVGLGVLGAAAWFGYNKFIASPDDSLMDTTATITAPEVANMDTTTPEPVAEEPAAEVTQEKPQAQTKPKSRVDQELAKYKAKEQGKSTNTSTAPATQPKPDAGVKIVANNTVSTQPSKVLMEVGKKEDPKSKNPKNPTKLSISKPTMIVRITTDHYNDGMGTSSTGTISIKDKDGNVVGTFRANGRTGKNGAPNAKWVAEPNKLLAKGTYYIWDSEMATWSKTFMGNGFVVVEGYETE